MSASNNTLSVCLGCLLLTVPCPFVWVCLLLRIPCPFVCSVFQQYPVNLLAASSKNTLFAWNVYFEQFPVSLLGCLLVPSYPVLLTVL